MTIRSLMRYFLMLTACEVSLENSVKKLWLKGGRSFGNTYKQLKLALPFYTSSHCLTTTLPPHNRPYYRCVKSSETDRQTCEEFFSAMAEVNLDN